MAVTRLFARVRDCILMVFDIAEDGMREKYDDWGNGMPSVGRLDDSQRKYLANKLKEKWKP